jgi:hypothetical protein
MDVETKRDESQQMRFAGFAAGDVVPACEVSLRFQPVPAAVSSDSSYPITISRSLLRALRALSRCCGREKLTINGSDEAPRIKQSGVSST